MTLYDVYVCTVCNFSNKSLGPVWTKTAAGLMRCPKCFAEGAEELLQGPSVDRALGFVGDDDDEAS